MLHNSLGDEAVYIFPNPPVLLRAVVDTLLLDWAATWLNINLEGVLRCQPNVVLRGR